MPKFTDQWVIDRTMFEFVSGGSCACCGMPSLFLPDGVNGLINSMSDLETDAANAEISALDQSPWPPQMRTEVWSSRVKLRHLMKKEIAGYQQFWASPDGPALVDWITATGGVADTNPKLLKRWLQMPKSAVAEMLGSPSRYNIHAPFSIVVQAVTEQLSNFAATGYPTDGRGREEIAFEKALVFDRRGGFTLNILSKKTTTNNDNDNDNNKEEVAVVVNQDVLKVWLDMMKNLGEGKLLERAPRKVKKTNGDGDDDGDEDDEENDDEDEGDADDHTPQRWRQQPAGADENDDENEPTGPSFRSDRRIVRLMIARSWADLFIQKYKAWKDSQQQDQQQQQQS